MTRPISLELREKIVNAYEANKSTVFQIAEMLGITPRSVYRFVQRYKEKGDLAPDPIPGRPPVLTEENLNIIEKIILKKSDGTLQEYRDAFEKQTNISVSYVTIHNACKILDLRLKKKVSMRQNKKEKT